MPTSFLPITIRSKVWTSTDLTPNALRRHGQGHANTSLFWSLALALERGLRVQTAQWARATRDPMRLLPSPALFFGSGDSFSYQQKYLQPRCATSRRAPRKKIWKRCKSA